AIDQAAQAARCALAMRDIARRAPMALATGRGEDAGALPVGEVIDRAAELLRLARANPGRIAKAAVRPIRLDEVTAGLLDLRFVVGGDEGGLELWGEREAVEETRTLLGKSTPFLGRDQELTLLREV